MPAKRTLTEDEITIVKQMRADGRTRRDLARVLDCSAPWLLRQLRAHGLDEGWTGTLGRPKVYHSPEAHKASALERFPGIGVLPDAEVARRAGVTRQAVFIARSKAGIAHPSKSSN